MILSLTDIEKAAREATPGTWTYSDIDSVAGGTIFDETVALAHLEWDNERTPIHRFRSEIEADANGRFISLANPQTVLKLIAVVRDAIKWSNDVACVSSDADEELIESLKGVTE